MAVHEAPRPAPQTVLMRLFRMADGHRQRGEPNQAIEMFLELIEQHGHTPEGRMAQECLMEICDEYERAGKIRQARALYERLL
jgi:lipopolysaccharide biosynthesis regulator YciM